ncbi:MAG: beta-galactosidase, partial [Dysgonamonadaceae bacterium]|nr:beta-galactosidase [Dysgonamonadaceae bacterium]
RKEWKEVLDCLQPFPSIVVWTVFNEGWGQFDAEEMALWTKAYDPSRLINPAAGAMFVEKGDLLDIHSYPMVTNVPEDKQRAVVVGGYGGTTVLFPGHQWQSENIFGHSYAQDENYLTTMYAINAELLRLFIAKGLSAVVYTQLTDVEGEMNGLMTYDREMLKIDEARIRETNEKLINGYNNKK